MVMGDKVHSNGASQQGGAARGGGGVGQSSSSLQKASSSSRSTPWKSLREETKGQRSYMYRR